VRFPYVRATPLLEDLYPKVGTALSLYGTDYLYALPEKSLLES
jgi:hypothetical protein